jgi:glycine/D-amino acid oxidase-like deaminating enzyme
MEARMRVAVIGCGVVGSCVGWHLARRGAQVVMIDAGQPGAGVSNWTFSWVNASNKTQTRAYFDLNVAGMSAHRELATTLGSGDWWHPTGHLRWSDDPVAAETLHEAVELLRSWGYDAACWDADRVRRLLEPEVRFPADDTAVAFYRDEGWIDGRRLVGQLIDDAVSNGAELHAGTAVTDIVVKGDHVTEIVLSGGHRDKVDAVVNAAGPAGREVAGFVGRTLPMRDEPGLVVRLGCDRVPVRRAMHAPHVEVRPDDQHQVVLHSREVDALIDPAADPTDLSGRLHDLAIDVVPALRTAELIDARVAWRPIPIDGFPSVGGLHDLAGYYEAVTHSGITLSVTIGRVLAREIIDGTVDELIEPYRPGRFAGVETKPRRT